MSLVKAKRNAMAVQDQGNPQQFKCCANGCRLHGTISTMQDKWVCAYHHMAETEKWPIVTESLRMNEDLIGMIGDLVKISEIVWDSPVGDKPAQRDLYITVFESRPELQPLPNEKRVKYEYRLRDYVAQQVGVLTKARKPTYVSTKPAGHFYNPSEFF